MPSPIPSPVADTREGGSSTTDDPAFLTNETLGEFQLPQSPNTIQASYIMQGTVFGHFLKLETNSHRLSVRPRSVPDRLDEW